MHAAVAAELTLRDHAERTGGDAVAAAVADVVLDHDGAELGPEDRPCRADVEATGVRAVLADVRLHQPAEVVLAALDRIGRLLLHEGDVPPGVCVQLAGVVVGVSRPGEPVLGHEVPLLAGHFARLAADADGRVREEAQPRLRLAAVGLDTVGGLHAEASTVEG